MKALFVAAKKFAKDEEGITAIEYGLIAAVIAAVLVGAFSTMADKVEAAFKEIGEKIGAALPTD